MLLKDENVDFIIWEQILTGRLTFARVDEYKGILFEIRPKESPHNVPHCHVSYAGKEVSISLIDFSVLAGNIPKTQQREASKWIENHISILKKYWDNYHAEIVA